MLQRLVGAVVPPIRTTPHQSASNSACSQHEQVLRERGSTFDGSAENKNGANTNDTGDIDEDLPHLNESAGVHRNAGTMTSDKGAAFGALLPFLLRRLVRERWNATYGPGSPNAIAAAAVADKTRNDGDDNASGISNGRGSSSSCGGEGIAVDSEGLSACPLLPAPFNGQRQVVK